MVQDEEEEEEEEDDEPCDAIRCDVMFHFFTLRIKRRGTRSHRDR